MKKVQLFLAAIIIVFASCEENPNPGLGTLNSHECVDLGLSVRWATMNVGANSPEEVGWAFSWGETKVKSNYSSETYSYSHAGSLFLPLANDAAHVHWGGVGACRLMTSGKSYRRIAHGLLQYKMECRDV